MSNDIPLGHLGASMPLSGPVPGSDSRTVSPVQSNPEHAVQPLGSNARTTPPRTALQNAADAFKRFPGAARRMGKAAYDNVPVPSSAQVGAAIAAAAAAASGGFATQSLISATSDDPIAPVVIYAVTAGLLILGEAEMIRYAAKQNVTLGSMVTAMLAATTTGATTTAIGNHLGGALALTIAQRATILTAAVVSALIAGGSIAETARRTPIPTVA